jgi:hypothetical protein
MPNLHSGVVSDANVKASVAPPMALHEMTVATFIPRDAIESDRSSTGYAAMFSASKSLAKSRALCEHLADAVNMVTADQSRTTAAKADAIQKLRDALGEKITASIDEAGRAMRSWSPPRAPQALTSARDVGFAREAAAAIRGMKTEKERIDAIERAINENDELVLDALLGKSSPVVLGLTRHQIEAFRGAWLQKHHPAEAQKLERWTKAQAAVDRAGKSTIVFLRDLIQDNPAVRAAQETERAVKAALAAAGARDV